MQAIWVTSANGHLLQRCELISPLTPNLGDTSRGLYHDPHHHQFKQADRRTIQESILSLLRYVDDNTPNKVYAFK